MTDDLATMSGWIADDRHPRTVRTDWWIDEIGPASLCVDCSQGARLVSLVVAGEELLADDGTEKATVFSRGCFAMVPYAGRVESGRFSWRGADHELPLSAAPHAAHGVTADTEWTMTAPGTFDTELDERWPLGGWARQEVRGLSSGLELSLTVGNDNGAMPANIGFHPWFRSSVAGRRALLDWPVALAYTEETPHITSRRLAPRRNEHTWCAPSCGFDPVIRWPSLFAMTLSSAEARCWVVHERVGRALCVEPQTAPGNALRAGDADVVSPGRPLTLRLCFGFHGEKETDHVAA